MARTHDARGGSPCSICRKWPPIESSPVFSSTRLPWWLKWYQYASMEGKDASNLSAMSRASVNVCEPGSGITVPRIEQPVLSTSIGAALAGSNSMPPFTSSGKLRSPASLSLYASSSVRVGRRSCSNRCAISSNSQDSAISRIS